MKNDKLSQKYSFYLPKAIMEKVAKDAVKEDRSINYMVKKALEEKYGKVS